MFPESHMSIAHDVGELTANYSPRLGKIIVDVSADVSLFLTIADAAQLGRQLAAAVEQAESGASS